MKTSLHLDFETFASIDLKSVGAYRYAFSDDCEILCAAMALGDEEPVVWSDCLPSSHPEIFNQYWDALQDPSVLIYCHSAQFEMAICQALLQKTWGIPCPALSRFRCTASLARRAALPAKLETLAITLGLTQQKDNRGKALIKKFSMLQPAKKPTKKNPDGLPVRRIRPEDEPETFAEFCQYCAQDVRTEQEVARKLAYFYSSPNNENYSLDAIINARGVPVNLSALRHAQKLIDEETELVSARFREMVGFEITQNAKLLAWINEFPWIQDESRTFSDLQAETIEEFLNPFEGKEVGDNPVVQALRMKQSIAYASIKKVKTMLACAGPQDNRIRGLLTFHGASTGRWSGSLVQFQNMRRSTIASSEEAYRDICAGMSRNMLELCYGPVLEVIASSIRHFVHDVCPTCSGTGEGNMELEGILSCPMCGGCDTEQSLLDCDYAAIEARIVNWLSGQEDALEEYRNGVDRYKRMASVIYGIPEAEVNKFPQRFLGKTTILACSYGMGPAKFRASCLKMGYELPEGLEDKAVASFRAKHPKIKSYWRLLEDAAKRAIVEKGTIVTVRNVKFLHKDREGMPFLHLQLPSGRQISYPKPRVQRSRRFENAMEIVFFGHILGTKWGDVPTYGAKICENICQAVAADIMANGAMNAEKAGYETATLIHDECLSYYHPERGQTVEEFVSLLTKLPPWAAGLPIAAEGEVIPFYKK